MIFIKKYRKVISLLLFAIFAYFVYGIIRDIYREWEKVNWSEFTFNYVYLLPYFLATTASFLLFAVSWHFSLRSFKVQSGIVNDVLVYMRSQIGKYIPGKVALVAIKIHNSQKIGIPVKEATLASSFEIAIQIYVMMIIGSLSIWYLGLGELGVMLKSNVWIPVVGLLALSVLLHPKVFRKIIGLVFKLLKRPVLSFEFSTKDYIVVFILKFLGTLVSGAAFYFIIKIIYPIGGVQIIYLISATSLAFFIGLISLFAPSGVGVRDTALIYILRPILPIHICVVSTLLLRLCLIIVELLLIGLAYLLPLKNIELKNESSKKLQYD